MPSIGGYNDLYNQPLTFGTDYYQLDNLPEMDYGGGFFDTTPSFGRDGTFGIPSPYDFSGTIFGDVSGASNADAFTFENFLNRLGGGLFGGAGGGTPGGGLFGQGGGTPGGGLFGTSINSKLTSISRRR